MKRSREEIFAKILNVCKNGANKTRVVYQANLNFRTVNPYLETLIGGNLIEVYQGKSVLYKTTEKGTNLLEAFSQVNKQLS